MRKDLALSMLLFVGVCLGLWILGGGIPYGYDGIEIYFTYLVGHNAATFPHVNPLMADIAASADPAAHPYYYTHHPNLFGHLLSQLLIRLGVVDLRWHGLVAIGITAAGIFVGARLLRDAVGPTEAIAYVVISSAHYVGVLSWAPVLLRSFHFVLFWVVVSLTNAYLRAAHRGPRMAAVCAWTYVLFLNDYALAPFIYLCQLGLVALGTREWKLTARFAVITAGAAAASVATWVAILVSEFGAKVVLQDVSYTYLARNAGQAIQDVQRMVEFYREHRIVFWGVLVDTTDIHSLLRKAWLNATALGQGALSVPIYGLALCAFGMTVREGLLAQSWFRRFATLLPQRLRSAKLASTVSVVATVIVFLLFCRAIAPNPSWLFTFIHGFGVRRGGYVVAAAAVLTALCVRKYVRRSSLAISAAIAGTIGSLLPIPLSPSSYAAAALILLALSVMWTAAERLRSMPSGDDSRRDVSAWLAGAVASVSVPILFALLSLAAIAAAIPDRWHHGARYVLSAGVILSVSLTALLIYALLARRRLSPARLAGALVRAWRTWLCVVALLALSAAAIGTLATLFSQYQEGQLSWPSVKGSALQLLPLTVLLAVCALVGVRGYLSMVEHTGGRDFRDDDVRSLKSRLTSDCPTSGVTLSSLIVALFVSIGAMTMLSVGPFTMNFVYTYKPALVFLEDVILAAAIVAAIRWIARMPTTSYQRALATALLMFSAFYWFSYQAFLAYRYPPTEIGISRVVASEAFRNASFVEESMYAAIWYYTRGTGHSVPWALTARGELDYDALMFFHDRDVRGTQYRHPSYLVCVRQHVQPKFDCRRWITRLKELGYQLSPGVNLLFDEDFMIFRMPTTESAMWAESR